MADRPPYTDELLAYKGNEVADPVLNYGSVGAGGDFTGIHVAGAFSAPGFYGADTALTLDVGSGPSFFTATGVAEPVRHCSIVAVTKLTLIGDQQIWMKLATGAWSGHYVIYDIQLRGSDGRVLFYFQEGGVFYIVTSIDPLVTGTVYKLWLTVDRDAGELKGYVNDVLQGTVAIPVGDINYESSNVWWEGNDPNGTSYPHRIMYDTRVWPTTKNATFISNFNNYVAPGITVTSVTANHGYAGDTVTIGGTSFVNGATAKFGATTVSTVFVNSTTLTAVVPAHAPGAVDVKVTNPDTSNSTLTNGFTYDQPVISSVVASSGYQGDTVLLNGMGFQSGAIVTYGGISASVAFVSSIQVSTTIPAHAIGAVNVVLTNLDGGTVTRTNGFTYLTPLSITTISPSSGPIGTEVTITGTGFTSGITVSIGGIFARTTFVSNVTLKSIAPSHVNGPVDVVITIP